MIDFVAAFFTAINLIISQNPDVMEITFKTLEITFSSVLISTIIALPLGTAINFSEFRGKKTLISLIQTLYALPTVIVGLVCFMLLSRSGPLGFLGFLFTPSGMIFGQAFLVIPIMTGLTIAALQGVNPTLTDTIRSLGATKSQFLLSHLRETRYVIMAAIVIGFSRALSEVGAAIMIGGNIKGHTRVLTTAISLQTSMGNFELSLALGIILLGIALIINLVMGFLQQR
ncbi:ABC transporter permease [Methanospirillum sp. J.3.6.1-F.2.7.3]|jgi:tungstate transport system permease protein|uniref:ABC transporter permease n=1 Tax=Methanospirillum purgamenti TaxID=2834276 RepID=A0A8E7AX98_9EURY|nr:MULTISPECIES: ABC transporter permease [Methanospirillum]MDX8551542.1 ABC transporter permease [Methanospirillum hungatei]NLW75353.1 ABC transporter permease [Methanomicrobiales archaeon]QVV87949.1 ABC transporter permease [Methanospirillum sp. J.3.6.1-F.2.7.3]